MATPLLVYCTIVWLLQLCLCVESHPCLTVCTIAIGEGRAVLQQEQHVLDHVLALAAAAGACVHGWENNLCEVWLHRLEHGSVLVQIFTQINCKWNINYSNNMCILVRWNNYNFYAGMSSSVVFIFAICVRIVNINTKIVLYEYYIAVCSAIKQTWHRAN